MNHPAGPRDGSLDLRSYTLTQLQDLKQFIDSVSQPLNYANLLAEIERRESLVDDAVATPGVRGRFSARNGWLGWIDAKRRRSPVYGRGSLEVNPEHLALHGLQRTWLGTSAPAVTHIALDGVRNVASDGEWLEFEFKRPWRLPRHIRFKGTSPGDADSLAAQLPRRQTAGFGQRWAEIRAFHARVDAHGGRAWQVMALTLANIAVFVSMAIVYSRLDGFDVDQLIRWGANFGPATIDRQWWRLLTATFLHASVLHLVANMWVLFNAGRLARQVFGSAGFLSIYFGTGVCASLVSLAWDPATVSVGASGAIFGVLGAFLAFLLFQRRQLPAALLRAHWMSTLVFVAFNLISGTLQTNIDNAAHVGGMLSGFVLGWLLARPLDRDTSAPSPVWRYMASLTFVGCVALATFFQVNGVGSQMTATERFRRENAWYVSDERNNLALWQSVADRLGHGAISEAEASRIFERDIIPFWKNAHSKFEALDKAHPGKQDEFFKVMFEFARLRRDWAEAIADATRSRDAESAAEAGRLMQETDRIQAQIERLQLRDHMEHRPRALAHSLWINRLRALLNPRGWECVANPTSLRHGSATDSRTDAPALRHEVGCQAQRLFHEGDYRALDLLIRKHAAKLNDLPDGGSSVTAVFSSLSTLIDYGGYEVLALLGKTADWRRTVDDPLMADLVEVMIFQDWAWSARGHGTANEVSGQAWYVFAHRSEMAAAALRAVEKAGQSVPLWHDLSIDVALDLSEDIATIREIFNRGIGRFPSYHPLYAGMLRVLMPRWHGSYEEVDRLINDVTRRGDDQDLELYAELYWTYFLLEQDDCNIFVDAMASWNNVDLGFAELVKRHPRSDYLLNAYAVMACLIRDRERYAELRPRIARRLSESAWSEKYSLARCDRDMRWPR